MNRVKIEKGRAAGTKNKFSDVFIKSANVSRIIPEGSENFSNASEIFSNVSEIIPEGSEKILNVSEIVSEGSGDFSNVSENISEQSAKNKKYSQSAYSSFISLWRASFARKFASGIEAVYN